MEMSREMSLHCETAITSTVAEPDLLNEGPPVVYCDAGGFGQPVMPSALARKKASPLPLAAGLVVLGATVVGGIVGILLKRATKKKIAAAEAAAAPTPAVTPVTATPQVSHSGTIGVDLSPFGSPVSSTPVHVPPVRKVENMRPGQFADNDADDQSDNASVRDQRHVNLVDATLLQKTLKQMQEMAEENRKLSAFLAEFKADAEKLSRLEEENRALRGVTRQLEVELQDLKTITMPRTGAELEMFKSAVSVPAIARSVCSNDETIGLGASTASVDMVNPDARVRRNNVFKQLLATLQGSASAGASQPETPRTSGGSTASATARANSRQQRRQPLPEEAAVIGQAVYQLLDQFGGRMM
ncbi:hypothetical protein Vretimale_12497 [Volvox reticuliferus]|uniref:Uncharacterized protein n=1 Tax=Volvox reticuliferus TaxID=1737510 RepID=A0A8J4FQ61_9CHLO|nr:hypothetical protein Vretifemale_9047 [Volvox reticuliferus]GIM08486.1 hypothetical protein Vretimale_12497 [Volvox reticuliferus]